MDEFVVCALACLALVLVAASIGLPPQLPAGLPFWLCLFGASSAGFFAIGAIEKSGMSRNSSALCYAVAIFAAYFAAFFASGAIWLSLGFLHVPLIMCAPAVLVAVKSFGI